MRRIGVQAGYSLSIGCRFSDHISHGDTALPKLITEHGEADKAVQPSPDLRANTLSSHVAPQVSVLMAVYNGETHLGEAIASILSQTYSRFEFIIVVDGSTDSTAAILSASMNRDKRIIVHSSVQNVGLGCSLNKGFQNSTGAFIARMDADDISTYARLTKQVQFMQQHPEIGVCGTWTKDMVTGKIERWPPTDDATIRCTMLFHTALAHPTVMIRRSVLEETGLRYNPEFRQSQDYELWTKLAPYTRFANIPEPLLLRRSHSAQTSTRHRTEQETRARQVRLLNIDRLGLTPDVHEEEVHHRLAQRKPLPTKEFVCAAREWLLRLRAANQTASIYSEPALSAVLATHWFRTCRHAVQLGWWSWQTFWSSPLSTHANLTSTTKLKFAALAARHGFHS